MASGVRRIEATTGKLSLEVMNRNQELLFHAAQVLKTTPGELAAKAEQQAAEMKELRHELEKFKSEASLGEARQFLTAAKNVGGLKVLTAIRNGMDANALRQMGDFLRDKAPDVVAVLASANGEKITFLAVCGKEAVAKGIKAGDILLVLGDEKWGIAVTKADVLQAHAQEVFQMIEEAGKHED